MELIDKKIEVGPTETFEIVKIKGQSKERIKEHVASEAALTINTDAKELVTLLCTPQEIEDLVRGFLFTSGYVLGASEIERIDIDTQCWTADVRLSDSSKAKERFFRKIHTSGCSGGVMLQDVFEEFKKTKEGSDLFLSSHEISALMNIFQKMSVTFFATGCTHSSALADREGILVFREDIGRHNAIDKVVGNAIEANISLKDKIMFTSGRISMEVIFKMQKCNIPVVVSRSAPTDKAIKLAKHLGITLIGFARSRRMNVYSGEARII